MNSDIRLSVDFFSHHKTKKVLRKIGPEGVICLVRLFCYVGKFRPEGRLDGMDVEDISDAVDWSGDAEELVSTLCGAGFIEQSDDGVYIIHDWEKHNPWAAGANERSLSASKAGKASAEKRAKTAKNTTAAQRISTERSTDVQREGNGRSTESNEASTPSPSPSPLRKELEDTSLRSVSSCPEPSAKASEPQQVEQKTKPGNHDQPDLAIMTFPLAKKGETFAVTQPDIDEWGESFPGIDLLQELRHCLQWSRDNPTRRKTRAGIRRHITSWLAKAQDRTRGQPQAGHAGPGGYPAPRTVKDAITIQQDMEAKRLLEKKLRERGMKNENGDTGGGTGCSDDAQHQIGQGVVQRQRFLAGPGIH